MVLIVSNCRVYSHLIRSIYIASFFLCEKHDESYSLQEIEVVSHIFELKMGRVTITTETLFNNPVKTIYEHVADPRNWGDPPKSMKEETHSETRSMKFGDQFLEKATVGLNVYVSSWFIISAVPSGKWVIQTVNNIGGKMDGTPGVDGICTMTCEFCVVNEREILLKQEMVVELPRDVKMPDGLLLVYARPHWIDASHEKLKKELRAESACTCTCGLA